MERAEYLNGVNKFMYQGEVLGEAILACYVALEQDAVRRYKWGTILQLETEIKARLRPFLTRLGLSIAHDDTHEAIAGFAQSFSSKSWPDHMRELAGITGIYL